MEIVFQTPWMFLLVLFIPILIILHLYFFQHAKKRAMKFSNFAALKRVTGTTLITKNTGQLILRILIFITIILAATQPVIWYKGKASVTDYVIAIDTSASMISDDVLPTRLDIAKQAANSFLDSLEVQTKVALISFAGVTFIQQSLTDDLEMVKHSINNLEIELSGGTDIGSALITGANILNPGDKSKAIILLTDGSDTAGVFVDESIANSLEYVRNNHIIVHTIGIGTGLSGTGYIENPGLKAVYDKSSIQQIAQGTGGKFYEVKNSPEISAAFLDIEKNSGNAELSFEATYLFMGITFILLLGEWGLLNTKFRAIP